MANIVILEEDSETREDLKRFLEEIESEKEVFFFDSYAAMTDELALLEDSLKEDKEEDKEKKKEKKKIDLFILSSESLKNPVEDLKKIRQGIKIQELNPEEPSRIILSANEGSKTDIQHLVIEDLIYKPYEKLLFLQKVEIALNLPENTSPSFLALQPIKEKIELGKVAPLKGFSELGIEIYNPNKINEGAFVRFYSKIFNDAERLDKILTRSYGSYKEEAKYICRFDFYGSPQNKISELRRAVAKIQGEKYPIKRKVQEEVDRLKVIIVDADKEESANLKSNLENYIPDCDVLSFPSYVSFLKTCFGGGDRQREAESSEEEDTKKITATEALEGADEVTCFINKEFQTSQWEISDKASFLKKAEEDWKANAELLINSIDDRQKELFEDFMNYIFEGNSSSQKFVVKNEEGEVSLIQIIAKTRENGADLTIKDLTKDEEDFDYENLGGAKVNLERIDLIFIDAAFIKNLEAWFEGFNESINKIKEKTMPKIILTSKKGEPSYVYMYKHKKFFDFLVKPIDRSFLAKKLLASYATFLEEAKGGELKASNIQMVKSDSPVMLATEVDMLSLSEYGISIRFNAPMVKNRFIHFYLRSFLGMEDISPILARCYFSEADEAEKGKYICYFTFLGVTDEVFKRIRVWMREYYIKSKDQS